MKEVHLMPASLAMEIKDYFATTTGDTLLCAPGIYPCIGGLFYRQGHLGLAHFDPDMESVIGNISDVVAPSMQRYGSGDIGCRLFTGMSFATRREFQRNAGIRRYHDYVRKIEEYGFVFDENGSRTYILANNGPSLIIEMLQAKLIGDTLDGVEVTIKYLGDNGSGSTERSSEVFEINMRTNKTRVVQPFSGHKLF